MTDQVSQAPRPRIPIAAVLAYRVGRSWAVSQSDGPFDFFALKENRRSPTKSHRPEAESDVVAPLRME